MREIFWNLQALFLNIVPFINLFIYYLQIAVVLYLMTYLICGIVIYPV